MIGICAAGGRGTRMLPATRFVNKCLIPCGGGKLMVDFPLEHLSAMGFESIQLITGSDYAGQMADYVGDGERYGFKSVEYRIQPKPLGIADCVKRVAHVIAAEEEGCMLILGDNYFSEPQQMTAVFKESYLAHAWEYDLGDPEKARAFGQIVHGADGSVAVVEKPTMPVSSKILTGLYYFPADVAKLVADLTPSQRGELEITGLLDAYAKKGLLKVHDVRGKWDDLGTWEAWGQFMRTNA